MFSWDHTITSKLGAFTDNAPFWKTVAEFIARWLILLFFGSTILYFSSELFFNLLMIATLAIGYTITLAIGFAVRRKRPYETPQMNDGYHLTPWVYTSSFPSGHAMLAFIIAGMYAISSASVAFLITAYVIAVLISLSRVVVGMHYLTDVMVGALIGVLVNVVTIYFLFSILKFGV